MSRECGVPRVLSITEEATMTQANCFQRGRPLRHIVFKEIFERILEMILNFLRKHIISWNMPIINVVHTFVFTFVHTFVIHLREPMTRNVTSYVNYIAREYSLRPSMLLIIYWGTNHRKNSDCTRSDEFPCCKLQISLLEIYCVCWLPHISYTTIT